ncbi:MAG: hypothetical protein ABW252_16475 [Polyangiales bacterium]
MRSSYVSRFLIVSSLVGVACVDANDAPEDEDAPILAQAIDGGATRVDAGAASRDAAVRPGDGGASSSSDGGSSGGGGGVDMKGTWFARVTSKADITAPLVGAAPSDVIIALRLFVSEGDEGLKADVAVCSMETKSGSLALDFAKVVPFIKVTEEIPAFTATVGGKVPLPDVVFQIGQDASGAGVDMDGDGKPGATIPSVALGAVPFDAYVGMDLKIAMEATLKNAQTVAGTSTFSGTGKVLGSTIPLVSSGAVGVKQTQIPTNFEAKRYEGDVPCATLLTK